MKKLVRKLLKKCLDKPKFNPGELVKLEHGDLVYEVVHVYYSPELVPVLFIRDSNGRLYAQDPMLYVHYRGIAPKGI